MKFETAAIHAGQPPDPATGAAITPIYATSTYTQDGIGRHKGFEYSRTGNPTRAALEQCLAALEGGKYGLAFASGLAAETAVLSILRPGDHVVANEELYGGTFRHFERICRPNGISFSYVRGDDPAEFDTAARPETKIIWLETPANPLLRIIDIAAVAEIAQRRKIHVVVDNTFASPYFQNPLALGAHVVVHSTTKYIGGHSDVIGGAVVTSDEEIYHAVKFYQNAAGGVPGPFDAFLTLRGLKTLAVRMREHEKNAAAVAEFLLAHKSVENVRYPGLPGHPGHKIAARQMRGYSGMVTFDLRGGRAEAEKFATAVKVFSLAESLGGVESLVCVPAFMTHASYSREARQRLGITDGTIRLSVGLEHIDDLLDDLTKAFAACG